jgi:hypothetical protein
MAYPLCVSEVRGSVKHLDVRDAGKGGRTFQERLLPPEDADLERVIAEMLERAGYRVMRADQVAQKIKDAYYAPKWGQPLTEAMKAVRDIACTWGPAISALAEPEMYPDDWRVKEARKFWGPLGEYLGVRYVMRTVVLCAEQEGQGGRPLRETSVELLLYDTQAAKLVLRAVGRASKPLGAAGDLEAEASRKAVDQLLSFKDDTSTAPVQAWRASEVARAIKARHQSLEALQTRLGPAARAALDAAERYAEAVEQGREADLYPLFSRRLTRAFTREEWAQSHRGGRAGLNAIARFARVRLVKPDMATVEAYWMWWEKPATYLLVKEDGQWRLASFDERAVPSWTKSAAELSADEKAILATMSHFLQATIAEDWATVARCMSTSEGRAIAAPDARRWAAGRPWVLRRVICVSLPDFAPLRLPWVKPPEDARVRVGALSWSKGDKRLFVGNYPDFPLRKTPGGWRVVAYP